MHKKVLRYSRVLRLIRNGVLRYHLGMTIDLKMFCYGMELFGGALGRHVAYVVAVFLMKRLEVLLR